MTLDQHFACERSESKFCNCSKLLDMYFGGRRCSCWCRAHCIHFNGVKRTSTSAVYELSACLLSSSDGGGGGGDGLR
jgi:hypothetical protein